MAERLPFLSHLDPRRDMEHVRALGTEGVLIVPYRNFVRGGIFGALGGAVLDQIFLDGGLDMALLSGASGAILDMAQGLGRGMNQIVQKRNE